MNGGVPVSRFYDKLGVETKCGGRGVVVRVYGRKTEARGKLPKRHSMCNVRRARDCGGTRPGEIAGSRR